MNKTKIARSIARPILYIVFTPGGAIWTEVPSWFLFIGGRTEGHCDQLAQLAAERVHLTVRCFDASRFHEAKCRQIQ